MTATDEPGAQASSTVGRQIASAALLVMVFFVLSRVIGLAREMIIGAQFGTSQDLDAYLAAFRVPDMLFQLVAGGALGSAFIPTFASYWAHGDRAGAWLLFSRVLNLVTLVLIAAAALAALFAPLLVRFLIAPGFAPAQAQLTANLMRIMLIGTVVFGASGLVMGALNAARHFLWPAAAPIVYNLSIIAGALFLARTMGVYGLAIGAALGACCHLLVQLPQLARFGARYSFSINVADPGVAEVVRLLGPRALGLFFVQMQFLINTILASGLEPGSISALNYAWLLMLLPQGVFAQAVATAAFPTFAAQAAVSDWDGLRHSFSRTLNTVLFLALPAAVGLFVIGPAFIDLLLERGQFTAQSTALVAYALRFYAVGLLAHAGLEIVVRAFYAMHDTWTPVVVGVGAMLLNILLSFLLVRWLSFGGLALANSAATTLELLILLLLLHRRLAGIDLRSILLALGRSSLAALAMGGLVAGWMSWLAARGVDTGAWWAVLCSIALAVGAYLLFAWRLRSAELQPALDIVTRRLRRARA